jgi:hypothetical protein
MAKYRKKPVEIEAVQFRGNGDIPELELSMIDSDTDWICTECGKVASDHGNVKTLEGFHIACPGDWIITGIKGEHYPCKPDIFEMTYDKVDDNVMTITQSFVKVNRNNVTHPWLRTKENKSDEENKYKIDENSFF